MEIIVIKRKQWIFLTNDADFERPMNSKSTIGVMPQNNHPAFHIVIILTDQNVESVFTPRIQIIERK